MVLRYGGILTQFLDLPESVKAMLKGKGIKQGARLTAVQPLLRRRAGLPSNRMDAHPGVFDRSKRLDCLCSRHQDSVSTSYIWYVALFAVDSGGCSAESHRGDLLVQ